MNPEVDARLSALLDGELSSEQESALRAELARSPELATRLAALAAVDDGLRGLPGSPVPPDLRARLARRLREDAPARRAPLRARRRWLGAAAAAAAVAAAFAWVVLPRLARDDTQLARTAELPVPEAPAPPAPAPAPALEEELVEEYALAGDLPVIEVLDVLAELDELEEVGSG
jgi:anti-sigma factor RsiW